MTLPKHGAYLDNEGNNWNHTTGIITTPNPIILTIMTKNVGAPESFISQRHVLAKITLSKRTGS